MASENRQDPASTSAEFDIRRKLLKAVAGSAPLVMTLPVGTEAAAASLACTAKPLAPGNRPPNVIVGTDSWVRKRVTLFQVKLRNVFDKNPAPYDILAWEINGLLYAAEGQGHGYSVGMPVPKVGDEELKRKQVGENSLLYYVAPDGSSAQVYPLNAGSGNPLSTSCWTSTAGSGLILG